VKEGKSQFCPGEKSVQWHGVARRKLLCPEAAQSPNWAGSLSDGQLEMEDELVKISKEK